MIGRLSCSQCNDGKRPVNRSGREHDGRTTSGVRDTCAVCSGSGYMPYRIQAMLTDAQLAEHGLTLESIQHFRTMAKRAACRHTWSPTDNDLIDRCQHCGEERA